MRNRLTLFVSAFAASLGLGLIGGRDASAQVVGGYWYGIVTVHNDTKSTINYQYCVGDGNWQDEAIKPGFYRYYWHKYDYANENRSPILQVRFDSDMSDGIAWRQYSLERNPASHVEAEFGHRYDFKSRPGNQVDLFDHKPSQ
jgi:hypothetical protein